MSRLKAVTFLRLIGIYLGSQLTNDPQSLLGEKIQFQNEIIYLFPTTECNNS